MSVNTRAALRKIRTQWGGDSPGHRLCLAIFEGAVSNYRAEENRRYLLGDIIHAQLCGVDPDWIRSVLRRCGIDLEATE